MERWLGRYSPQCFAILRIVAGVMFVFHGLQKLFGWPGDKAPAAFPTRSWIAGVIEVGGGSLIAIGLFAGFAAFLCSGLMAFAYFLSHAKNGFFPIMNRGELAVVYCFLWLYVASHGAGIWSLDAVRTRRRR
ncbi:MAG TPA: DoxX family protein [Thermoanaerobaculia bacterium]|nr:DoxX family protein [Thermoanaerobaculia bacterium]